MLTKSGKRAGIEGPCGVFVLVRQTKGITDMPATKTDVLPAVGVDAPADKLLLAPVGSGGPWSALQSLRSARCDLRSRGTAPEVVFVLAVARDGRMVQARDPHAAVLLLGFNAA